MSSLQRGNPRLSIDRRHPLSLAALALLACQGVLAPADDPAPPTVARVPFLWPVSAPPPNQDRGVISQQFAEYGDGNAAKFHTGVDVRAASGTVVIAVSDGWVALVQRNAAEPVCSGAFCDHGFGNTVILGHLMADGTTIYSQYSHLTAWDATDARNPLMRARGARECQPVVVDVRWSCTPEVVWYARGDTLGRVSHSGNGSTGPFPHLHFEIKRAPVLGNTANEGASAYGYSSERPTRDYFDPVQYWHPEVLGSFAVKQVQAPNGVPPTAIFMGPGAEQIGTTIVRYRRIADMSPGMVLEAFASATSPAVDGCSSWVRVRPPLAEDRPERWLRDRYDPSGMDLGRLPSGWVCAGATREPYLLVASLGPGPAPPSDLYTVGVGPTGSDENLGRIRTADGEALVITDIAAHPDGTILGATWTQLYRLEAGGALAVPLGAFGVYDVVGLAYSPEGELYASTASGSLLRRVPGGQWEVRGFFGAGLFGSGDLAFGSDGSLYGTVYSWDAVQFLVHIDRGSGAATVLSPKSGIGFPNVFGLSFAGNELYGMTADPAIAYGGHLIRLNVNTGVGSLVRRLSFPAGGGGLRSAP